MSHAEEPEFLTSAFDATAELEHVAFDSRPPAPEPAIAAPAASSGESSTMAPPRTAKGGSAADAAAAMRDRARGGKGGGKGSGKGSGKDGSDKDKADVKERTKLKRQRDQSASFLGGRWKSEEEMHMRDNFDS